VSSSCDDHSVLSVRHSALSVAHLTQLSLPSKCVITSPAAAVAKYCDEYVCLSVRLCVCLSIREDISRTTRAIFTNFLCVLPMSVAQFSFRRVDDRPHRLSPGRGFSSPLKNALSATKGDGSAQRGRSMLSTIALFDQRCPLLPSLSNHVIFVFTTISYLTHHAVVDHCRRDYFYRATSR